MPRPTGPFLAAVCLALVVGACANQQPTRSGFLSDYSTLRPTDGSDRLLEAKPDPAVLAHYSEVFVEPVVSRLPPEIAPADARELTRLTETALKTELAKEWRVVATPSPATIRVRAALTAIRKSDPGANVVLTIVAVPLINGGLSAEAEFLDGRTNRRIGAISWADEGRLNPVGYYTELGHPRDLTGDFARAVSAALARPRPNG